MDRTVFSQERVRHELRRMALIRADVTRAGEFSSGIMKRLSIIGPPTIVFLNPQGVEQADARIIGSVDSTTLLQKVAEVLGSQEVKK
jgi:thiol:disulfide interchange protein DsbD